MHCAGSRSLHIWAEHSLRHIACHAREEGFVKPHCTLNNAPEGFPMASHAVTVGATSSVLDTSPRTTDTLAPVLSRRATSSFDCGLSAPERPRKTQLRAPRLFIQRLKLRPRPPRQPTRMYALPGSKNARCFGGTT